MVNSSTDDVLRWRVRQRPSVSARARAAVLPPGLQQYLATAEAALADPFRGVTADGQVVPGLFAIEPTGVSTRALVEAARAYLDSLTAEQRARGVFGVDGDAWRQWSNIHPYLLRHGVSLDAMTAAQRDRALALLAASLSAAGLRTARDVMRLNEFVRTVTGRDEEYGEWLYWLSVMGDPSDDRPWGFQIDGHHLIVNCFVLGDQVVMTPMFMGSEPVDDGAGTRVFAAEEARGLELMRSLGPAQRARAVVSPTLPTEAFTAAFRDNFELRYAGLPYAELSTIQQELLLALVSVYVDRIRPGHAQVRLAEVKRHLADTWFAWMGGSGDADVFYYRVHSPVALIEFDHQRGIAFDSDVPTRDHIHTVVRTPNGNDYGRDLLRQHHAQFDHSHADHRHR